MIVICKKIHRTLQITRLFFLFLSRFFFSPLTKGEVLNILRRTIAQLLDNVNDKSTVFPCIYSPLMSSQSSRLHG